MNPASAKTSTNQIPALVRELLKDSTLFPPKPFTQPTIFDFGAGKKGKLDALFEEMGVWYLPYDPFNRSNGENFDAMIDCDRAKFAICCNVLNVLEDEALAPTISRLAKFTSKTKSGFCFVSVYHRPALPVNRQVNGHFQRNQPIEWYIPHLKQLFKRVDKVGKFLGCAV